MSRTIRNLDGMHPYAIRFPKTENERKQLEGVLNDPELMEFPISGLNHMKAREHKLPSAWNDKVISGYFQEDYR